MRSRPPSVGAARRRRESYPGRRRAAATSAYSRLRNHVMERGFEGTFIESGEEAA